MSRLVAADMFHRLRFSKIRDNIVVRNARECLCHARSLDDRATKMSLARRTRWLRSLAGLRIDSMPNASKRVWRVVAVAAASFRIRSPLFFSEKKIFKSGRVFTMNSFSRCLARCEHEGNEFYDGESCLALLETEFYAHVSVASKLEFRNSRVFVLNTGLCFSRSHTYLQWFFGDGNDDA